MAMRMSCRLFTDERRKHPQRKRPTTVLWPGGTLEVAGRRLARASALGDGGRESDQHDRHGRGPGDRVRARTLRLLAELAGTIACIRRGPPCDRDGPAWLRSLADAE